MIKFACRFVAVVAFSSLAAATAAQYKSVGPDGRVTYSDVPPPVNARVLDQKKAAVDSTPAPALPFAVQQAASRFPVTLYTGDKCAPCNDARTYLRARGVPFAERTVTSDEDIALFRQQSPDGTAPVVTVGGRKSIGFSETALAGLLDSAGYPATAVLPRDYQNPAPTPLSPSTRAPAQSVAQTPPTAPGRRPAPTTPDASAAPAPSTGPSGFRF